jgi:hypothetical protein
MVSTSIEWRIDCNSSCGASPRSINVERITQIERKASMEIFNLAALVDDRRTAREREARFERLHRRKPDPEPTVRPAEPRCTATVEHAPRSA